jgi:hypothetical protein
MPLDKGGSGRANADNQVGRVFAKQRTQILDERNLRILITGTGRCERLVGDVQHPRRLLIQLRSDRLRILFPRLEMLAKGMEYQHMLGLGCGCA